MKEGGEQESLKNRPCKASWICMALQLASLSGGLVLGWWVSQFRSSNKQLWMVPFSLVLMITPIFVLISVFISNFCTSTDNCSSSVSSCDHENQSAEIR